MMAPDRSIVLLEVCVDDAAGLTAALAGGADRIELCADLSVGGLTPEADFMRAAAACGVPVHAMIRPRAGNFRFSRADVDPMLDAIAAVKAAGLAGVVVGAAGEDGALDGETIARLVAAARPLDVTLHRVFDETPAPFAALEAAIALGLDRVLTSGQAPGAAEGVDLIGVLVRRAAGRIAVMAGAGVTPANVSDIVRRTGVSEVHGSFRGASGRTDATVVGAAKQALQRLADEQRLEVVS